MRLNFATLFVGSAVIFCALALLIVFVGMGK